MGCLSQGSGGELHEFLGLRFTRNRSLLKMSITQESMVTSLVEKCGLSSANPVPVLVQMDLCLLVQIRLNPSTRRN